MNKVIIIGDSTHNTLSAVRSFGEAKISQYLIMVCREDTCYVRHSKYLRKGNLIIVKEMDECMPILKRLASIEGQTLITTFDGAAEWVDKREQELSKMFRTPCRGKQIGKLFNKDVQCKLAKECGLDVPFSIVYHRTDELPVQELVFPLITKPLVSSAGVKEDIHICKSLDELETALLEDSHCENFLLQQFIDKEYEINAIGVRTDSGIIMGGAIHKYRHWPRLVGASSFGLFNNIDSYNINVRAVEDFLAHSNYHGPFSVEFLHTRDGRNYFMEVNFRNDGLAYAATCAGANLHDRYVNPSKTIDWNRFHRTYMMNYSIDLLYVKEGDITFWQWLKDLLKTHCFINICFSDLGPAIAYYKQKILKK